MDGSQRITEWRISSRLHVGSLRCGSFLADNRVLKSGGGERFVPILDAFDKPGNPFLRSGGIDVINDGLHGFRYGCARILLFEAPARDVASGTGAIIVGGVIHLRGGEVADALVEQARHHRMFGQAHHAVMQHDGRAVAAHGSTAEASASTSSTRCGRGVAGARVSDGCFRFDIFGERRNVIDEGTRGVKGRGAELLARAHLGNVGIEQTADVDHRIALMICGDVERHNNGGVVGILHRFGDRSIRLRGDAEIDVAQIHAVVVQLPGDHAIGNRRAAIADADGGLGDLRVPKVLRAEFGCRNFVVEALAHLMNGEQTLLGFRVLGNDAFIGLRVGRPAAAALPPPARPPPPAPPAPWGGSSWANIVSVKRRAVRIRFMFQICYQMSDERMPRVQ